MGQTHLHREYEEDATHIGKSGKRTRPPRLEVTDPPEPGKTHADPRSGFYGDKDRKDDSKQGFCAV
jgi:hypothetical protein